MSVFAAYAECYDLLYADKDYAAEAAFVLGLARRWAPETASVLELGCGTGGHAAHWAASGLAVLGVDQSLPMLERFAARRAALRGDVAARLEAMPGDLRSLRLGRRFDAVFSLFHVFSYLRGPEDLASALLTAAVHLGPGGLLLFDCWHGPAVLAQGAEPREKRAEDSRYRVLRKALPVPLPECDSVEVRFMVEVEDKASGQVQRLDELHRMRYFFPQDVEAALAAAGFALLGSGGEMRETPPDEGTWGAWYAARRLDT